MRNASPLAVVFALLGATLSAQNTTYVAPAGFGALPGNGGGNAIPFWSGSGVYMQVHDAADLASVFPTPVGILKALSFRKANSTTTYPARTVDMTITVGITPVTAQTASTTFANNLGPSPTMVLPYTNLSLPLLNQISNPNPQGWFFPFTTPFLYLIPNGNFCYEIRFKNLSATGGAGSDSVAGSSVITEPLLGTGCIATGQTQPAAISTRTLNMMTGAFVNRFDRGAASSPAALFFGAVAQKITVPNFCSSLETLPLVTGFDI